MRHPPTPDPAEQNRPAHPAMHTPRKGGEDGADDEAYKRGHTVVWPLFAVPQGFQSYSKKLIEYCPECTELALREVIMTV